MSLWISADLVDTRTPKQEQETGLSSTHLIDRKPRNAHRDRSRRKNRELAGAVSSNSGDSASGTKRCRKSDRKRRCRVRASTTTTLTSTSSIDAMEEFSHSNTPSTLTLDTPERPVCGLDCRYTRSLRKGNRVAAIKEDILRKLKLDAPVNITNRPAVMPRVPYIDAMMENMMQGDQPYTYQDYLDEDLDDDRATTLRVFNFAEPGELTFLYLSLPWHSMPPF